MPKLTVGIITHYYKSLNYGGNLQAYALTNLLNNKGVDAKQICYIKKEKTEKIPLKNHISNPLKKAKHIFGKIFFYLEKIKHKKDLMLRKKAILKFNSNFICHTDKVYDRTNIQEVANGFDVFIVGSDQVWNPLWCDDTFLLNFVAQDKIKLSYAAGISVHSLSNEEIEVFKKSLLNYNAISVRESNGISLLQPLTDKKIENVIDPTLLLSNEEWDKIVSSKIIQKKYIFCYFLSGIGEYKTLIKRFAKRKKLKIVNLPHLCGYQFEDEYFADYRLYDISPVDFISLIKHAELVFTDSFHATVFSHIYKKNFFVFNRAGLKSMNDRIYSLTSLFDTQDRFCDTKEKISLKYIEGLPSIDYDKPFPKFEAMKEKSINFLKNNLKRAEEKTNGVK